MVFRVRVRVLGLWLGLGLGSGLGLGHSRVLARCENGLDPKKTKDDPSN